MAYLSRNGVYGVYGVYDDATTKRPLRCDEGVSVQPPSAAEETSLSSFLAYGNLQETKKSA